MKTGIELIAEERKRQTEKEGWTLQHDDGHDDEALAMAAAVYAMPNFAREFASATTTIAGRLWPFDGFWFKRGDRVRELAKAGSLIAAEIDRLNRASSNTTRETPPR